MSYNIDRWITKQINKLSLKLSAFDDQISESMKARGWKIGEYAMQLDGNENIFVTVPLPADGSYVKGMYNPQTKMLEVVEINLSGEGSGTTYHEIFIPAMQSSSGILDAVLIWERCDSITRLTVRNGITQDTEVSL